MDGHLTNNLRESFLKPNDLIREAIQKIDHNLIKIVIVVDDDDVILGTITDGDIRRGILKGHSFEDSVHLIMNKKPTTGTPIESATVKQRKMKRGLLRYLPILDEGNRVVAIESYDLFASQVERENPVVLMAGGLGSRLGELTTHTPKPMLSVGNKPLLETILRLMVDLKIYISRLIIKPILLKIIFRMVQPSDCRSSICMKRNNSGQPAPSAFCPNVRNKLYW